MYLMIAYSSMKQICNTSWLFKLVWIKYRDETMWRNDTVTKVCSWVKGRVKMWSTIETELTITIQLKIETTNIQDVPELVKKQMTLFEMKIRLNYNFGHINILYSKVSLLIKMINTKAWLLLPKKKYISYLLIDATKITI